MKYKILDGLIAALKIMQQAKGIGKKLAHQPVLAMIIVGKMLPSIGYVEKMKEAGTQSGVRLNILQFESNINENNLIKTIKKLNKDKKIHGILIQTPLPKQSTKGKMDA